MLVKFGLSEKHTKFEKNLLHGFDKSADLRTKRQNHEEDFFKLCLLLKKSELYNLLLFGSKQGAKKREAHPDSDIPQKSQAKLAT